jgi:ribosomal protein L37AE/L43A
MTEKKEVPKRENLKRCKKCNSSFGYLRIKTKEWTCRNCGFVDKEVVA